MVWKFCCIESLKMNETGVAWYYKKYAKEQISCADAEAEARKNKL